MVWPKNTNGSQSAPTPISIPGNRGCQFSSSYGLLCRNTSRKLYSLTVIRLAPVTGDRLCPWALPVSFLLVASCPGFQASFRSECCFSQYLLQYLSKRQREDRNLRCGRMTSIPVLVILTPSAPGTNPLCISQ